MIVVKTPLRLSFVGGGSDMPDFCEHKEGKVISSAIDKFVFAIVKERFDDMIYINYSKKECVERVDEIQHDLVREAMLLTGVRKGVEITTLADIPSTGSGLGSSSAITVALLHAFYTYTNTLVTAERLASEACKIEIDILGKPIGRQDQYAAAYGGLNLFAFYAGGATRRHPVPLDHGALRRFSSCMLLYYTGMARSSDTLLRRQKENLSDAQRFGNMEQMTALVGPFQEALLRQDFAGCGRILDTGWKLKQKMAAGITNPEIEAMYARAKEAGALGGKIAGAGGGGFLMLLVPREKQNAVFEAMEAYRELPFMFEMSGSKVIFDDRSHSSR